MNSLHVRLVALCALLASRSTEAGRAWLAMEGRLRAAFGSRAEALREAIRTNDYPAALAAAEALAMAARGETP
jgi:hypothetical protein